MPVCSQFGVSANLLVCDLAKTVTNDVKLTMGKHQQNDYNHAQEVLAAGQPLPEISMSSMPEVHHLGKDGAMSLLMVKAGNWTDNKVSPGSNSEEMLDPRLRSAQEETFSCRSRLHTSSVEHPAPAPLTQSVPQAISLSIQTSVKTFCENGKGICNAKDLRVEAYLNGELVDVVLVPCRSLGRSLAKTNDIIQMSGTRVHRQVEKPWVYVSDTNKHCDTSALTRWTDIGLQLKERAKSKGVRDGERPLSGSFLDELAALPMPNDIKDRMGRFGILDVIIVAGRGTKYGPGSIYLMSPTALPDLRFLPEEQKSMDRPLLTRKALSYDDQECDTFATDVPSPSAQLAARLAGQFNLVDAVSGSHGIQQSGDILTCEADTSEHDACPQRDSATDVWKTACSLSHNLSAGLEHPYLDGGAYDADNAITAAGAWTSQQTNNSSTSDDLSSDTNLNSAAIGRLDFDAFSAIDFASIGSTRHAGLSTFGNLAWEGYSVSLNPLAGIHADDQGMLPALEHQDLDLPPATYTSSALASPYIHAVGAVPGIGPHFDNHVQPPLTSATSFTSEYSPCLVDSEHYINEYAQASPILLETPISGIDYDYESKIHTPKKQKVGSNPPQRGNTSDGTSKMPKSPTKRAPRTPRRKAVDPGSPLRPGSHRSAKRWNPFELTIEQAVERFEIPDLTRDSAISYAGPKVKRQIPKIRGGEFIEEVFICGMRFIVE